MANERLRAAMASAGQSIESVARSTDVDPKTVQRWLSGRIPHQRHRFAVAERLHENEEFLWPDARRRVPDGSLGVAEIVAAYPYRSQVDPGRWWRLISKAEHQVDLLGYTLYFLPQQHPDLISTLLDKCEKGCRIRMVFADPQSEYVEKRDDEEQEPITLRARIASSMRAFAELLDCPSVEIRLQDVPLYNSVFRFDDQMFVTPMLFATPGHAAPLLHLRRLGAGGMFSRFADHFEGIWAASRPIGNDRLTSTRTMA